MNTLNNYINELYANVFYPNQNESYPCLGSFVGHIHYGHRIRKTSVETLEAISWGNSFSFSSNSMIHKINTQSSRMERIT